MDGVATSINSILKNLITDFNTLLDCPARFSGEFNEQKIHCFVEYIEYYKRIKCIKDEQALQELQFLLVDDAHNWWMRRKGNIETWSEALTILENQYSKKRPANKVYEDILRHPYQDYQSKYDFIDDKIELFTELSQQELSEKNKLDIIYALIPCDVQNRIKLENITSLKDLKKHLKLVIDITNSDQPSGVLNSNASDFSTGLGENANIHTSNKEPVCQEINKQLSVEQNINGDSERDPVIKVKRTEDLMPRDVKEEYQSPDKIILNDNKSTDNNNGLYPPVHENFQIDSDIMNQINNIIEETEMCIEAMNKNEDDTSTVPQTQNSLVTLEFLGFQIEPAKQKESANKRIKSVSNSTKKTKKRCTYCRNINHTAAVCFKRAKHMKLFPERFEQTKDCDSNKSLNETNNKDSSEISPSNTPNNNLLFLNTQETEISVASPNITQPVSNITTTTDSSTAFTSPPVSLNNVAERSINSIMTTKLIPAINGKAPNKILAAKLRNMSSPSPKCHQCGTLGFYKSICPNCSPIYNSNSHK